MITKKLMDRKCKCHCHMEYACEEGCPPRNCEHCKATSE